MRIPEINKKFEKDRKSVCHDSMGNDVRLDNLVKCIEGRYKGKRGFVKHIHKETVFLWDKEFA